MGIVKKLIVDGILKFQGFPCPPVSRPKNIPHIISSSIAAIEVFLDLFINTLEYDTLPPSYLFPNWMLANEVEKDLLTISLPCEKIQRERNYEF